MHDEVGAAAFVEAEFGARVREVRLSNKWTQRQLAEALGVDASAVSRIEQGTRAVRLAEAAAIADALGANLDALVYGKGTERQLKTWSLAALHLMDEARRDAVELSDSILAICRMLTESPSLLNSQAAQTLLGKTDNPPSDVVSYLRGMKAFVEERMSDPDTPNTPPSGDPMIGELVREIVEGAVRSALPASDHKDQSR